MKRIIVLAPLALVACTQYEPITDQSYHGGKYTAPVEAVSIAAPTCDNGFEPRCRDTERHNLTGTPSEPDMVPGHKADKTKDKHKAGKSKDKKDTPHTQKNDRHKQKGNASANNGKGGNYGKTSHADNGKGRGRSKK